MPPVLIKQLIKKDIVLWSYDPIEIRDLILDVGRKVSPVRRMTIAGLLQCREDRDEKRD
jgi:hypothetical protein